MAAVLLFSAFAVFVVLGGFTLHGVSAEIHMCASACSCLLNLVDCSDTGLIEVPKDLPVFVTRLELQNNGISTITGEDFKGLNNLTQLDLSNNEIRILNASVFVHLASLKQLKINHNKITEVPMLIGLKSLTSLEMNHNRIHTLAIEFLIHMSQLKSLELNHNQLTDITPGTFPANNSLQRLTLNGNGLETFEPGCFGNLTALETLKMNKNRIRSLPKQLFMNMTKLKVLEMTKNQLRAIEGLLFHKQANLQVLKLRKNSISVLNDGAFWGLDKIQNLQLDNNNITIVTQRWLYRLESLKQLTLSNNKISVIESESLEVCKYLQNLDLSNNRLTAIKKESFSKLYKLQSLYLNNNLIANIDDGAFRDLPSLELLELNNNAISWTIEDMNGAFVGLENLNKLGLENNKIKSIAKNAFDGLSRVKVLNLQNNAIASIQRNALESMTELVELSFNTSSLLCDCQLSWLPQWLKARHFENSVTAVCAHPVKLRGKSIYKIDPEQFKCEGDFLHPVITVNPLSQIALKGENITLNCSAASTKQSHTEFTWKKDNVLIVEPVIENFVRVDGDIINYTSHLHLNKIHHKDAGRYQCVITNEFGSAYSSKAEIGVHVFPVFVKTPQDITVKAGTTARLECSATGQPSPIIAWKKDGGEDFPAARERRMHVMTADDVFFIVEVNSQDEGVYSCTAKNDAGKISANATLKVLETPSFVRPMEKMKMTPLGETTVLECMASGSPQPKLTWMKNGSPLEPNQRYFFTANNQLLIIVQTSHVDEGRYTCMMSNTLGQDRGYTQLTVTSSDGGRGIKSVKVPSVQVNGPSDESTTTGIIIIAVVCCVVGTSLVWVIIIYQTRKRHEMYSATPTDETTLPGEIPSTGYTSSDKEGSFTQPVPMTVPNYQYQDYQMKESGYESSSGRFRAARAAAIFPSDVDEEEHQQSVPLTLGEHQMGSDTPGNSVSSLHYPNSETDSLKSSHSTNSTRTSEQHMLRTFHPVPTNHDTLRSNRSRRGSASVAEMSGAICEVCEQCQNAANNDINNCPSVHYRRSLYSSSQQSDIHHGSQPQPPGKGILQRDFRSEDRLCDSPHQVKCNCCHQVLSPVHNSPVNINNSTVCNHVTRSPTPHTAPPSVPPMPYAMCHNSSQVNTHDCRMCAKPSTCVAIDNNHCSHRNNVNSATSVEKIPPVIPPKTHKHSLTHSKMNGTVQNGTVVNKNLDGNSMDV